MFRPSLPADFHHGLLDGNNLTDRQLAVELFHEFQGHARAAFDGSHPIPGPQVIEMPYGIPTSENEIRFEMAEKLRDAAFAKSFGWRTLYNSRMDQWNLLNNVYTNWKNSQ